MARALTTDVGTPTVAAAASARRFWLAGIAVTATLALAIFAPDPLLHGPALAGRPGLLARLPDRAARALLRLGAARASCARAPIEPSWWGLLPLALGVARAAVGRLGVELMAMRIAFVLTLIGLVLLLLGRPIFRILRLPAAASCS